MHRIRLAALSMLFVMGSVAAQARETYTGYAVPNTGAFPRSGGQRLVVTIQSYTPPEETKGLVDVVRAKGQKGLEKELWKREVGRFSVGDRLSYPIATANRFSDPELGTERIVLLLSRPISYSEIARSARSKEYPFTLVELVLDGAGSGSGEMLVAARIELNENGTVEIENLDAQPVRILKVQRVE